MLRNNQTTAAEEYISQLLIDLLENEKLHTTDITSVSNIELRRQRIVTYGLNKPNTKGLLNEVDILREELLATETAVRAHLATLSQDANVTTLLHKLASGQASEGDFTAVDSSPNNLFSFLKDKYLTLNHAVIEQEKIGRMALVKRIDAALDDFFKSDAIAQTIKKPIDVESKDERDQNKIDNEAFKKAIHDALTLDALLVLLKEKVGEDQYATIAHYLNNRNRITTGYINRLTPLGEPLTRQNTLKTAKELSELNELIDSQREEEAALLDKLKAIILQESHHSSEVLSNIFQIGKKITDVVDDAWYALRNFMKPEIAEKYGPFMVGVFSGLVAAGEFFISVKETLASIRNRKDTHDITNGTVGAMTAVVAGISALSALALITVGAGVALFGTATAAMAPALPVIIPALMTVVYGFRLGRNAYLLHHAKHKEAKALAELNAAKTAISTKIADHKEDKEDYDSSYSFDDASKELITLYAKQTGLAAAYEEKVKERLTAEREVSFAAVEFFGSAVVLTGIVLGVGLIVGTSIATMGVGPILLGTLVLVTGVGIGLSGKIFEAYDEKHGHAVTRDIRNWFVDKFDSLKNAISFTKKPAPVASKETGIAPPATQLIGQGTHRQIATGLATAPATSTSSRPGVTRLVPRTNTTAYNSSSPSTNTSGSGLMNNKGNSLSFLSTSNSATSNLSNNRGSAGSIIDLDMDSASTTVATLRKQN